MSEAAERYAEKRGWDMPRTMDYRRMMEAKAKSKLKRIAKSQNGMLRQGYLLDGDWDVALDRPVVRRWVKQVWMPGRMRQCKKESRRKVRKVNDISNGNQYRKQYDLMWTLW